MIASQHNFPLDIPFTEIGIGLVTRMLSHPGFYSLIAERDGSIVGSLFLDERGPIAAVDPLTVDPSSQNQVIGRRLMLAALERVAERRFAGLRLCNPPITVVPCAYTQSSALSLALHYPARNYSDAPWPYRRLGIEPASRQPHLHRPGNLGSTDHRRGARRESIEEKIRNLHLF